MIYPVNKTALVLIDPFNDFLSEGGKLYPFTRETVEGIGVVNNLSSLITESRANRVRVVYAPHHRCQKGDFRDWKFKAPSHLGSEKYTLFETGSWGGEFHPYLSPVDGDLIAQNHWTASGFANTDLDFILKLHGIEYIVLAGMRANTCIDSTARYGVELGYHVTLIKDAIGAFNFEEIRATVEVNFPNYGHNLLSTNEFVNLIKK